MEMVSSLPTSADMLRTIVTKQVVVVWSVYYAYRYYISGLLTYRLIRAVPLITSKQSKLISQCSVYTLIEDADRKSRRNYSEGRNSNDYMFWYLDTFFFACNLANQIIYY